MNKGLTIRLCTTWAALVCSLPERGKVAGLSFRLYSGQTIATDSFEEARKGDENGKNEMTMGKEWLQAYHKLQLRQSRRTANQDSVPVQLDAG